MRGNVPLLWDCFAWGAVVLPRWENDEGDAFVSLLVGAAHTIHSLLEVAGLLGRLDRIHSNGLELPGWLPRHHNSSVYVHDDSQYPGAFG